MIQSIAPTRFILLISLLIMGCPSTPEKTSLQLQTDIDTTAVAIGDILRFRVEVTGSDTQLVRFPEWVVKEPLEIRSAAETFQSPDRRAVEFEIVFWDTGSRFIPAYEVEILNSDSSLHTILTSDSIPVLVWSTIARDSVYRSAGTVELKPIKGPMAVLPPWPVKKIGLLFVFFILIAGMVFIWFKRLPPKYRFSKRFQDLPEPDEKALARIADLKKMVPGSNGSGKLFYSELSHILREYVEYSFFIKTLEMTTEDIDGILEKLPFSGKLGDDWIGILKRADLVKYARQSADQQLILDDFKTAQKFVQETTIFWKRNEPSLP